MQQDFERYAAHIEKCLALDAILACFKPLDMYPEEEARWLVPHWLPQGQITLLASDGGVGKTSLCVNLMAAISSGGNCILDPPDMEREPATVAFFTTEDSISKKLKRKLREAGADQTRVIAMDMSADTNGTLRDFKFGGDMLAKVIRHFKPTLAVFDPVQGFVPPDVNMGSRNAMRNCMAPLIALGEETGTTFLIVAHTNKRKGASGRDRIADSADLWDVARSVWMAGYTEDNGVRYLSNEKNNYDILQRTILYSLDNDGQVQYKGTSLKRDRDYAQEIIASTGKRSDCSEWVITALEQASDETIPIHELYDEAKDAGYTTATLRRAVEDLVKDGLCKRTSQGFGGTKKWYISKQYTV